jgi:DNA-binding transcriptional LysR family regulator
MREGTPALTCAYPDALGSAPEAQFLKSAGLAENARCLTKNLVVIKSLIATGKCSGILASFMCGDMLDSDRYQTTKLPVTREVWLLLQPHLKDDPMARATIEWIKGCFSRDAARV